MKIDRNIFYTRFREIYGGLSQAQVDGYESIFDFWDSRSVLVDKRWLAYILATAFHETGRRLQPVRECFCDTDICSIRCVTRMARRGRIRRNYAIPHSNGHSYFGRGLVQLTHGYNYIRAGKMIGLKNTIYNHPGLMLRLDISTKVLCVGMLIGSFVPGNRLEKYFNSTESNWLGARKIINGKDKQHQIMKYALNFLDFIQISQNDSPLDELDEDEIIRSYDNMRSAYRYDDQTILTIDIDSIIDNNEIDNINIYLNPDLKIQNSNVENYKNILIDQNIREKIFDYQDFLNHVDINDLLLDNVHNFIPNENW